MGNLICIKTLEVNSKSGKYTFREGEKYNGNKINDKWWCVDAIGVETKSFDEYFVNEDYVSGLTKKNDDLTIATEEKGQ